MGIDQSTCHPKWAAHIPAEHFLTKVCPDEIYETGKDFKNGWTSVARDTEGEFSPRGLKIVKEKLEVEVICFNTVLCEDYFVASNQKEALALFLKEFDLNSEVQPVAEPIVLTW